MASQDNRSSKCWLSCGSQRLHIVCIQWDWGTIFGSFVVNTLFIDWLIYSSGLLVFAPDFQVLWRGPTTCLYFIKMVHWGKRDEVTLSTQGLWLRQACWRFSSISSSSISESVQDFDNSTTPERFCLLLINPLMVYLRRFWKELIIAIGWKYMINLLLKT